MVPSLAGELPEVAAVSGRDLSAFATLFESERASALRIAYTMTGDAGLAEDVVAEAFARTYERWSKGKVDDPGAYVRRAVVNEVRSTWRRSARTAGTLAGGRSSARRAVDRGAGAVSPMPTYWNASAGHCPPVSAVVVLRIVDDLSEQAVAEVLGCSVGTVKSHLSRGLARLRDALASEGVTNA